ncbi:hypothetical protein B0H34DRAFT_861710 [Crassisporium funariophilum]|nr:hypothetical protein B0H34DRAFT_861710 [Crassisporium funariophilum]
MAPVKSSKSQKPQQSTRADGGSYVCEARGESIRARGKKQHKCKGSGGTSLDDVFKEMAEQEALERARHLSLMANEPPSVNQGQSSRTTVEDLAWSETLPSPMQDSAEFDGGLPETEMLLSIIKRCIQEPEQHTLKDHKEIVEYWELAKTKSVGVKEDSGESGKAGYVNMKCVVWHEAFLEILKPLEQYAKLGCMYNCADGIQRWIFPIILILSADYEEQCFMALIRGRNGHFPCPVCLIPGECLSNLSQTYPLRTTETMKAVYERAQEVRTVAEKEHILKGYSLCDVKNSFWMLENTDVYAAISWDQLHAYHSGLFSDHLWARFKEIIMELGKPACEKFDTQINSIPRWRDLNHFSKLLKNSEFSDGTKYEDMGKMVLYGGYNVLSAENSLEGFLLLQVMRNYLELDMYASLTMHTEATLAAGREELQTYDSLIQEYKERFPESKSWDFPKAHSHQHLFDDVEKKGATRGFNSKVNEKRHRPFKKFYLLDTNFKDTDEQILKLEERSVITLIMRRGIEALDAAAEPMNPGSRTQAETRSTSGPDIEWTATEIITTHEPTPDTIVDGIINQSRHLRVQGSGARKATSKQSAPVKLETVRRSSARNARSIATNVKLPSDPINATGTQPPPLKAMCATCGVAKAKSKAHGG